MLTILIEDTKELPHYALPGITPAHEMPMLVMMARDLPLKKPLPEPGMYLIQLILYFMKDAARKTFA